MRKFWFETPEQRETGQTQTKEEVIIVKSGNSEGVSVDTNNFFSSIVLI